MIDFSINNTNFTLPESWEELPLPAMLVIIHFCGIEPEKRNRPTHEHVWQALLSVNAKINVPKFWKTLKIDPSQWHQMIQMIGWVYDNKPKKLPIDYIKILGTKHYITEPSLENVAAIEIAWMIQAYLAIGLAENQETRQSAAHELLAIVCRPLLKNAALLHKATDPSWNGDRRRPLSQHEIQQNMLAVSQITPPAKLMIVQYIAQLIESFVDEFSELFGAPEPGTIQPDLPAGASWESHLHRVAKEGTFGTFAQVCQTKARTIWIADYLNFKIQLAEIENQKQQAKAQKAA